MAGSLTNTAQDDKKLERLKNRMEINDTLVLAIAALAVTWCTYQSGLWDGIQTFRLAESNKLNRQAQGKNLVSVQHRAMDQGVLINLVEAVLEGSKDRWRFRFHASGPGCR